MNFFKLYIGDYQRDTAHLSLAENGAYLLMLQHYYATEKPLPKGPALHRMLRAVEKVERAAIDCVIAQFWTETEDGIINERALEEIRKSEHQKTVNREQGKRGGRPKKTERPTEQVTERITERETDSVIFKEPNDNPNHSHSHNHKSKAQAAREPDDPGRVITPLAELSTLARQHGISVAPLHPVVVEWHQGGCTPAILADAITLARDRKPAPEKLPPGYLTPIIADLIAGTMQVTTHETSTGNRTSSHRPSLAERADASVREFEAIEAARTSEQGADRLPVARNGFSLPAKMVVNDG